MLPSCRTTIIFPPRRPSAVRLPTSPLLPLSESFLILPSLSVISPSSSLFIYFPPRSVILHRAPSSHCDRGDEFFFFFSSAPAHIYIPSVLLLAACFAFLTYTHCSVTRTQSHCLSLSLSLSLSRSLFPCRCLRASQLSGGLPLSARALHLPAAMNGKNIVFFVLIGRLVSGLSVGGKWGGSGQGGERER